MQCFVTLSKLFKIPKTPETEVSTQKTNRTWAEICQEQIKQTQPVQTTLAHYPRQ